MERLRSIARFQVAERPQFAPSRVAFLVATDVDYGLLRMLGVFMGEAPVETRVFRGEEQARAWLVAAR